MAAKAKAGRRMRAQKRIRASKPPLCEKCWLLPPIDHILIRTKENPDGVRTWMCRVCLNANDPEYLRNEVERHSHTGASGLAIAREDRD